MRGGIGELWITPGGTAKYYKQRHINPAVAHQIQLEREEMGGCDRGCFLRRMSRRCLQKAVMTGQEAQQGGRRVVAYALQVLQVRLRETVGAGPGAQRDCALVLLSSQQVGTGSPAGQRTEYLPQEHPQSAEDLSTTSARRRPAPSLLGLNILKLEKHLTSLLSLPPLPLLPTPYQTLECPCSGDFRNL